MKNFDKEYLRWVISEIFGAVLLFAVLIAMLYFFIGVFG